MPTETEMRNEIKTLVEISSSALLRVTALIDMHKDMFTALGAIQSGAHNPQSVAETAILIVCQKMNATMLHDQSMPQTTATIL